MAFWRIVLLVMVFLLPGGSLLLLALATAKAYRVGKARLLTQTALPTPALVAREEPA